MRWGLTAGVPDEEVRRLISVARRRRFGRGAVVFHRDDAADSLHLVQKGRFAVRVMTPLGDTVTIAVRARRHVRRSGCWWTRMNATHRG